MGTELQMKSFGQLKKLVKSQKTAENPMIRSGPSRLTVTEYRKQKATHRATSLTHDDHLLVFHSCILLWPCTQKESNPPFTFAVFLSEREQNKG
ncbi:hypothetical protein ACFX13_009864 [Malus domestica]